MATANRSLITALRKTAWVLRTRVTYQWGHLGACNCGHLAQTVTQLSKAEIHAAALKRGGDWGELAVDHCPRSGLPVDYILEQLFELGLRKADIGHLEDLDDPKILARLPGGRRWLRRNDRDDVILYMETWADLLEEQLQRDDEDDPAPARSAAIDAA
ncbi:MAG: hypothetical protein CMH57_12110 [Myxococcales bacterium]|nr:hypothetical protein [Myxococcales bacterium]